MQNIFLGACLAVAALAENDLLLAPARLRVRQGDQSFTPSTTPITGGCPASYVQCPGALDGRPDCIEPSLGDVCCSEGYGCPGGSFCLTKGLCCPDGVDPQTCASQQGITLPDGFNSGTTVAFSASATSSSETPSSTSESPATTTSSSLEALTTTSSSSSAAVKTLSTTASTSTPPYVIPSNSTVVAPSGTGAGVGPTGAASFTGGANVASFGNNGVMAVFVGIFGLML